MNSKITMAIAITLLGVNAAHAEQATIRIIGSGSVEAVCADGSAMAGYINECDCAVRWSVDGVSQTIGLPSRSVAWGISGDGRVVTGTSPVGGFDHAFRWDADAGAVDLGCPVGHVESWGVAASHDGTVIVGCASPGDRTFVRAFRWSAVDGMQDLGVLPGFNGSRAWAVSADGSVIVGECDANSPLPPASCAFRWTQKDGMQVLPAIAGSTYSAALAVCADGSVIAGFSGPTTVATRWTAAGGPQDLGVLPGSQFSYATSISADGSVLVGWSFNGVRSFRWTPATGMKELLPYLASKGAQISGWQGLNVWPISADGKTYAGQGNYQNHLWAFAATGPAPCAADLNDDGAVSGADLGALLAHWGASRFAASDFNNDGRVDGADLGYLLNAWGRCPN